MRITWDTTSFTDNRPKYNRSDITVLCKDTLEWTVIDIVEPAHQSILATEEETVERYQDLALETKRIHRATRVKLMPIVIGAL